MKAEKTKFVYFTALAVIFLLFFCIAINTPMHSDDYHYFNMGNSLSAHYDFYLTWSGRFISDYLSTLIFSTNSVLFKALFTSIAATLLIFVISKISYGNEKFKNIDIVNLAIIFLIYWISNPALGQTTFWVVGTTNYLITNLFLLTFIYLIIYDKKVNFIFLCILAFLAGFSKEDTGFLAPLTCLILITKEYLAKNTINKNLVLFLLISIIAFSFLILSPGNFARAKMYPEWSNYSIFYKIFYHLHSRVPNIIIHIWPAILIFLLFYFYSGNKKHPFSAFKESEKNIAIYLLVCCFLSVLALTLSPTIPHRSMLGIFLLFLCFTAKYFRNYQYKNDQNKYKKIPFFIFSILAIFFIISYTTTLIAYKNTIKQQSIREEIINQAKLNQQQQVVIPDFYFTKLLQKSDKFDTFYNEDSTSKYYGINIKIKQIGYNYSDKDIPSIQRSLQKQSDSNSLKIKENKWKHLFSKLRNLFSTL